VQVHSISEITSILEKFPLEGPLKAALDCTYSFRTPQPLGVTSYQPKDAAGIKDQIIITFNQKLKTDTVLPKIEPEVNGSWFIFENELTFTPYTTYNNSTEYTVMDV
jgi:hypothetical protein